MSTHPTPEMVNREPIETPVIVAGLEVLAPTRIEFKAPTPAAYQTFEMILRCDAAEAPTERLIDPSLARDVLLEKLQAATEVRQRYNAFDRNRPVSDDELLQAYSDGADAYAGLMTLASDEAKPDEEAFEAFKSWSLLAVTALNQAEIRNGNKLHNRVYLTPAALANDPEFSNEIRETLPRLAQSQRVKQYWAAAQNNDAKAASEAFVGTDATRLNRAKALLYYAHYLPQEDTSLKVACLEESVAEIHTAVTTSERPSEDDLVGIYEYFMLESLLGIAVHDIVWLEDQDTKDGRARRLSVQYLTNASDALSYVRHHLTIDQSDIERAIQQNRADFNQAIEEDEVLLAARSTSDFLHAGKSQLETAKAALLNIQNDPYDYPEKQSRIDAAQQYVATLTAKAKDEQLDEKITKQNEVYAQRLARRVHRRRRRRRQDTSSKRPN